jgi:hypothetical protein
MYMATKEQLINASVGKSFALGGLNMVDIKEYLMERNQSTIGSRDVLQKRLQDLLNPKKIFETHQRKNTISLVDLENNRQYIIKKPRKYILILDQLKKKKYIINNDGTNVTDINILKLVDSLEIYRYYRATVLKRSAVFVHRQNKNGCYKFNSEKINQMLHGLNKRISRICPSMKIKFNHLSVLQGNLAVYDKSNMLTLCLYHNNDCISSIGVDPVDKRLELYSFTSTDYRGKGYNTLLRATILLVASILVCCSDLHFTHLYSVAENPISAHTLIKDFKVTATAYNEKGVLIPVTESVIYQKHILSDKEFKESLFEFYKDNGYLKISIEIASNIDISNKILDKLLIDNFPCA